MPKENLDKDLDDELDDDELEEGAEKETEADGDEKEQSNDSGDDTVTGGDSDEDEEQAEETDAKRERRKRERKAYKERQRRDKLLLQQERIALQNEVKAAREEAKAAREAIAALSGKSVESEMNELARTYDQAAAIMKEAITEGDGEKFDRAQRVRDQAFAKYGQLNQQKQQATVTPPKETERSADTEEESVDPRAVRYAREWARQNSWFDVDTEDGQIADLIGDRLLKEGYNAADKEYWDELNERLRERLPKHFKSKTKSSGSPPVGGSGREGTSGGSTDRDLPQEFVKTLKEAGYWDNPAKRKAAIANYRANQKAKGVR